MAPAAAKVAKPQAHQAGVVLCLGALRIYGDRGSKALQRLLLAVQRDQRRAFVDVQFGNVRRDGERSVEAGDRLGRTAKPGVKTAAFVEGLRSD